MLNIGIVGCGYWGPNLIRNFVQMNETEVLRVADLDEDRLKKMKELYPQVNTTKKYQDISYILQKVHLPLAPIVNDQNLAFWFFCLANRMVSQY